ncbi:hypothetical protein QNN00_12815 [Bacillus velezensis]|nr:hypothetical protein [Bacillus velezensis]
MSFLIQFLSAAPLWWPPRIKQIEILILIRRYYILRRSDVTEYSLAAEKYEPRRFQSRSKNGIFGAFGAVIFISSIFILTNWFKGGHAVIGAFLIYICYMIGCKCLL